MVLFTFFIRSGLGLTVIGLGRATSDECNSKQRTNPAESLRRRQQRRLNPQHFKDCRRRRVGGTRLWPRIVTISAATAELRGAFEGIKETWHPGRLCVACSFSRWRRSLLATISLLTMTL